MNQIRIDIDSELGFHPVKVVIQENGRTLIDMPSDEFISWLKAQLGLGPAASAFMRATQKLDIEANNEGDRPCEDGLKSDSQTGTGG